MTDDVENDTMHDAHPAPRRLITPTVKVIAAAALVAVVLSGTALGVALTRPSSRSGTVDSCRSTTPTLKVQGTGQATVTPDLLTVVVDVDATESTATAAMASDDIKVTGAVAAFRNGGVAAKDIQTSGLSLQPQYAYPKGVPTVTGYQVTNTVTATLRDVTKAGTVLDAVVGAAGNAVQIDSVSFSVANPNAVEDRARSAAVTQAVSHARAMAAAAGKALGPVCSLTDQTQTQTTTPDLHQAFSATDGTAVPAPSVPIEAGTQTETAQITLVTSLATLPSSAAH